jgi:hypothetical protein
MPPVTEAYAGRNGMSEATDELYINSRKVSDTEKSVQHFFFADVGKLMSDIKLKQRDRRPHCKLERLDKLDDASMLEEIIPMVSATLQMAKQDDRGGKGNEPKFFPTTEVGFITYTAAK